MKVNSSTMRKMITDLCTARPEYANDDKRLAAAVWWQLGWKDDKLYQHLVQMPSFETIRRTRAKLCSEGVITPSASTTKARREEAKRARKDLGY